MSAQDPVARARELLAKATPGPWAKGVEGPDEETPYPNYCVLANTGKVVEPIGDYLSEYDAEFVAAARDLVPELCEEVAKLRAEGEDETLDGTDLAHPAWWRGNDRGLSQGFAAALKFLEGDHEHGSSHPIAEQVRAKVRGLLAENERLRAELAELRSGLDNHAEFCQPPEDPAEATLRAREAERQAAAKKVIAKDREDLRQEAVWKLVAKWRALPLVRPLLEEYLGLDKRQLARFIRFGEIPAGWEPPADAFEGE